MRVPADCREHLVLTEIGGYHAIAKRNEPQDDQQEHQRVHRREDVQPHREEVREGEGPQTGHCRRVERSAEVEEGLDVLPRGFQPGHPGLDMLHRVASYDDVLCLENRQKTLKVKSARIAMGMAASV